MSGLDSSQRDTMTPWQKWNRQFEPSCPDPWISRKLAVIIVLCLAVWDFYVVVGRLCVPAIQKKPGATYERGAGVGILVAFIVLWTMFMWSYSAVITVPPGLAKDFVATSSNPYEQYGEANTESGTRRSSDVVLYGGQPDPQGAGSLDVSNPSEAGTAIPETTFEEKRDELATAAGSPPPIPPPTRAPDTSNTSPHAASLTLAERPARYVPRPVPNATLGPRWCYHCHIVKPDRTHHCRHCGTCILQFDHHCVWIGQCVGWRNHAIFITFTLWAGLFCAFNVIVFIIDAASSAKVDPQKVILIVISGFLGLFTWAMLPTHIALVMSGKSTNESFQADAQKQIETITLRREFPSCWSFRDMNKMQRQWNADFGGVAVNDRWAFGRKRDMWRQEMGRNIAGWVLPIGRPLGDGLHFHQNPRFGPNGEWLRMQDWPKVVSI